MKADNSKEHTRRPNESSIGSWQVVRRWAAMTIQRRALPSMPDAYITPSMPPARRRRWLLLLRWALWWFRSNTYVPAWIPSVIRQPWVCYAAAALIEVTAAFVTFEAILPFPAFAVRGALPLLALVLVAIEFGAGPSLMATLLGAFLLDYLLLPPYQSFAIGKGASIVGVVIFFIVGVLLMHVVGQRERARRAALEARRTIEEFVHIASHELRAPLAGAKMSVELAQRELRRMGPSSPATAVEQLLELMLGAADHIDQQSRLVHDLVETVRIQSGTLALQRAPIEVVETVCDVVREQHRVAPTRSISVHLPETPIGSVRADQNRVRQVVRNYLSNALKYSPPHTAVSVQVTVDGTQVRVAVQDYGPGLDADQQRRIWERYYRAPGIPVQGNGEPGVGLGLYISRTIIEQHGGTVGIESAPGSGSTFWFSLPLA